MSVHSEPDQADTTLYAALQQLVDENKIDNGAIREATQYLAMTAVKDMSWKKALVGPDRDKAIAALTAEKDSLLSTIHEPIEPDHPDYDRAVKEAISGRYLLDIKRSGAWKARRVKHGFKEDKTQADGPGFLYYSHVAKFCTIRMAIFRPNRRTRRLMIEDVRTAFLQSDKFPDALVKFVCFYDPLLRTWEYFRQLGPLYGECSAPIRWEDTYADAMIEQRCTRGENEPSIFYDQKTDTLVVTFVDDSLCDAKEDECKAFSSFLEDKFDCKDDEWLVPDGPPLDYLGMLLRQTSERIYLSMEVYICETLEVLGWSQLKPVCTPIADQIDANSEPLSQRDARIFMTGTGCLDWLTNTDDLMLLMLTQGYLSTWLNPLPVPSML